MAIHVSFIGNLSSTDQINYNTHNKFAKSRIWRLNWHNFHSKGPSSITFNYWSHCSLQHSSYESTRRTKKNTKLLPFNAFSMSYFTSLKLRTSRDPFFWRWRMKSLSSTSFGDPLLNSPIYKKAHSKTWGYKYRTYKFSINANVFISILMGWQWFENWLSTQGRNTNSRCWTKYKAHSPRHVCQFATKMGTAIEHLKYNANQSLRRENEKQEKITCENIIFWVEGTIPLQQCCWQLY